MSPQKQVDESTSLERDFRQAVSSLKLTFRQRMPIQEYAKQDLAAIQTSPVGDIVAVIRSSDFNHHGTQRAGDATAHNAGKPELSTADVVAVGAVMATEDLKKI